MGNCAGYCVSEAEQNKQKVTVEQRDGAGENDARGVAYIDQNRGEFEIDYMPKQGQMRVDNYAEMQANKGLEENDRINTHTGPTTLANGSVYTGERQNGKKHGRGVQVWPDSSRYEGMWEND